MKPVKEKQPVTTQILKRLRCSAKGCTNNTPGVRDCYGNLITFHPFPQQEPLRQTWKLFCQDTDIYFPYDYSRICSVHFPANLFRTGILHPKSVPTIQTSKKLAQHLNETPSNNRTQLISKPDTSSPNQKLSINAKPLHCSVPNCKNVRPGARDNQGKIITFHMFPIYKRLRELWSDFCEQPNPYSAHENSSVCSAHFTAKDFHKGILKFNAIPSIVAKGKLVCVVAGCKTYPPLFELPSIDHRRLSRDRRMTWIRLLGLEHRPDIDFDGVRVCSRHFKNREPVELTQVPHVDWAPSLYLPIIYKPSSYMHLDRAFRINPTSLQSPRPARYITPNPTPLQYNTSKKIKLHQTTSTSLSFQPEIASRVLESCPIQIKQPMNSITNPQKITLTRNEPEEMCKISLNIPKSMSEISAPVNGILQDSSPHSDNQQDRANNASLHDETLSELFVNGSMDRTQIGRLVVIDRVIDNEQQTFMLRLVDGAVVPPNGHIKKQSTMDLNSTTNTSRQSKLKRRRQQRRLSKQIENKPYSYVQCLVRRLSSRLNMKPKKKSFKYLVLTYRTIQKKALRKAEAAQKQR